MYSSLLTAIFLFLSVNIFAQEGQFFDAPFGGGIGYVPAWYIPNLDPINSEMLEAGIPELSTGGFYSSGIAGFIYIGFIKSLRLGGMGFGGSLSSSQTINNLNYEVDYKLEGGGFSVEYTLPFIKNIGVSIGAVIGGGNLELNTYRNDGQFSWNGIWEEFSNPDSTTENYSRMLQNSFWMFTPTINIDYPIYRFVSLRIGAGYQLTFGDEWTVDNDQAVSNVPSDLNGDSFFIQSGIFLGFFSY
ncbi:MAG: hypothetical protein ACHQLA_04055 [Ignavibacteriales bacterium]